MAESHLRHKKALLSEAKDEFLHHEITEAAYLAKANKLAKEIRELEAKKN